MVLQMIEYMEEKQEFQMMVLDAVRFINIVWSNVSQATIQNCLKKSYLIPRHSSMEDYDAEDDIPLSEWIDVYKRQVVSPVSSTLKIRWAG